MAKFCFILAFCATIVGSQYQQVHEAAKSFQSLRSLSAAQVDCILLNQVKLSHPEAVLQALQHARRQEPSSVPHGPAATLEIRFKGGGSRSMSVSKLRDSNRCLLELIEVTPGCISFRGEGICPELPTALEKNHRPLMKVGQVL